MNKLGFLVFVLLLMLLLLLRMSCSPEKFGSSPKARLTPSSLIISDQYKSPPSFMFI
jgi:hypothetical protein